MCIRDSTLDTLLDTTIVIESKVECVLVMHHLFNNALSTNFLEAIWMHMVCILTRMVCLKILWRRGCAYFHISDRTGYMYAL